ncbi:MAG: hypothetical protein Q606_CBAC00286G0001, partial [Intestinibacter bartlettii DORA_8_9]
IVNILTEIKIDYKTEETIIKLYILNIGGLRL